jgi:hypothetical protein
MSNTIEAAVHSATTNLIASGLIEKKIEEVLGKTIESAIEAHLRDYSDFGKQIKAKVGEALAVDFDRLTLPTYGASIVALIEQLVKEKADASIALSIKDRLTEMLGAPQRVIKLSKLVADFAENAKDDYERRDAERVGFFIHRDAGILGESFCEIHLDHREVTRHDRYSANVGIHLHRVDRTDEWKVIGIRIKGKNAEKDPMFALGCDAFERDLYSLYATGSRIVLDEAAVETAYPEDNECHC